MTTALATIIVLGVLVFIHEFGHFLLAKLLGVRVEAFSLGFPPRLLHKKVGDTDYRLSVIPLGGYVRLLGENPDDEVPPELEPYSFSHHPLWHRALIVVAGPAFNLLFAILALFLVFAFAGIPYATNEIGGVTSGSPAEQAGLQKGDQITAVDGQKVARWDELSKLIRGHGEQPLLLTVQRDHRSLEVRLAPKLMEVDDVFGTKVTAPLIGIKASDRPNFEQVGLATALVEGLRSTGRICWVTGQSIYKLVAREIPLKSLGGPILIAQVAGKQAEMGVNYLVSFMAFFSVNLALLNLLPIPILDGGHMFFILWEAVRGKPVHIRHREMAQALGLMLVLSLMAMVIYQDILRLLKSTVQPGP